MLGPRRFYTDGSEWVRPVQMAVRPASHGVEWSKRYDDLALLVMKQGLIHTSRDAVVAMLERIDTRPLGGMPETFTEMAWSKRFWARDIIRMHSEFSKRIRIPKYASEEFEAWVGYSSSKTERIREVWRTTGELSGLPWAALLERQVCSGIEECFVASLSWDVTVAGAAAPPWLTHHQVVGVLHHANEGQAAIKAPHKTAAATPERLNPKLEAILSPVDVGLEAVPAAVPLVGSLPDIVEGEVPPTPTLLQTLLIAFIAASRLLSQLLEVRYDFTTVALLPLQIAFKSDGSG